MKNPLVTSICIIVLTSSQMAHAINFTIDASVGGGPTGGNFLNFDDLALGSQSGATTTGPNGSAVVTTAPDAVVSVGSGGIYAAPFVSGNNGVAFGTPNGPDTTKYLNSGMTPGGVSLNFGGYQQYIGLLWGSIDLHNVLDFYDGNTLLGSVTGGQVVPSLGDGDRGANGTLYVNINTDTGFDRVVARSIFYAFELDNVSYNSTPLPSPIPSPVPDGGPVTSAFALTLVGLARYARRHS